MEVGDRLCAMIARLEGFEPTTPGSEVRFLIEILRHLVAIGQLSQQVLASLDNNGHRAEKLEEIKESLQHQG
jgi:hypothetical protein